MRSQRFHFLDSQFKKGSERSQRFHFSSSVVNEGSAQNQTCHLVNSDELNSVVSIDRDLLLMAMN